MADYLIGEVLYRQPADLRGFLLRTSIAERLTGGLADALTGGRDGIQRLRELERTNAFVVALDPKRITYRYHQLFAELLRAELHHQHPDEVAELHRRAARWHAADGVAADAIRHALAAEDWDHARDLLVKRWGTLFAAPTILRELLARLPPDLIRRDPELVKRFVTRDTDSVVSLSPTGAGPTATLTQHANWWTYYAVPGDESSGSGPQHGNDLTISAPGYGVIVHIAGQFVPDETFHGTFRFPEDPEVAAELCAALTG